MLDTFKVKGPHGHHLCIVYDVLREPIGICMDKFPSHLFSSDHLRILLPALLKGLDYLHSEARVVHTDLKADNIMMGLGDPAILDRFVQDAYHHPSPRKTPTLRIAYSLLPICRSRLVAYCQEARLRRAMATFPNAG